jgi:hypothetical protein
VPLLIGLLFSLTIATFIGLGGTWWAATRGVSFGGVRIGSWAAWPRSGTIEIDPYTRARIARSGELPVGSGDGVAFIARTDDAGKQLSGRCEVTLDGSTPSARYWTLTLYDPAGQLIANSVGRHGFTSQELVRRNDGSLQITVAPRARPGNWLPTGGADAYVLVLRLYDTPIGVATRAGRETAMPGIRAGECS